MSDTSAVVLMSQSTIAQASEIYAQLLSALAEGTALAIDATEVSRIDASVLQLLLSYQQSVQAMGLSMTWLGRSAAFESSARTLGMEALLES